MSIYTKYCRHCNATICKYDFQDGKPWRHNNSGSTNCSVPPYTTKAEPTPEFCLPVQNEKPK